jgi:hypothetical protein
MPPDSAQVAAAWQHLPKAVRAGVVVARLGEPDRRPIHLCPECLKKLRWNIGSDVVARYQGLKKFYEAHEMKDEAAWVEKRIQECRGK